MASQAVAGALDRSNGLSAAQWLCRSRHARRWSLGGLLGSLAIIAALFLPSSALSAECTTSWVGPVEGTWQTASNWSAGSVPTESDVVCIGSGKTVNVNSGVNKAGVIQSEGTLTVSVTLELLSTASASTISSLKQKGGLITGPANLHVSGSLVVEKAATMAGAGLTVLLPGASATLTANLGLAGRDLVNEGSFTISPGGSIGTSESPEILNKGTFTLAGGGLGAPIFVNEGTIKKTGTATINMGPSFTNHGTVECLGGVLGLSSSSSTSSSALIASEGGKFSFGGKSTVAGTLSGPVEVTGSTNNLTLEGVSGAGASVEVSSFGTLTVSGAPTTLGTLKFGREGYNQAHAILSGTGELKISSSLQAAYISGMAGSGTTVVMPSASALISSQLTLHNQRKLINEGTLTLTGSGQLGTAESGEIVNAGTITRSGTGTGSFGFLKNLGLVDIKEGKLSFSTGTSGLSSEWRTSGGAELLFGNYTMSGTLAGRVSMSGPSSLLILEGVSGAAGELEISNYGSVAISGTPSTIGTLRFGREGYNNANGNLGGAGELRVSTALVGAYEARMSGPGTTKILPGASASLSARLKLTTRRLINEGTVTLSGAGRIEGLESPEIQNTGTFVLNGGEGGAGGLTFVNEGTLRKIGQAHNGVGPVFTNLGTAEVLGGVLGFSGGSSSSSSKWVAAEGGKFSLANSVQPPRHYALAGTISGPMEISGTTITVTMDGVVGSSASVEVAHYAVLVLAGSPSTLGTLKYGREESYSVRASVTGSAELRITQLLNVAASGYMNGTGITRIMPEGSGTIASTLNLGERRVVNEGTVTQIGGIEISKQAEIHNKGTFTVNTFGGGGGYAIGGSGSLNSLFVNQGTVRRTAGTTTTSIESPFQNQGIIRVETGGLTIPRPVSVPTTEQFGKRSNCGDPVECATGNFSESQTDLAIGGRGVGLVLTRSYSAQAAAKAASPGAFGYGWSSSFSDRLQVEESGKKVTLVQGNGNTETFNESGGALVAPSWSQDELSGSPESGYTLTRPSQMQMKFSGTGRLESVTDRNGNQTTLGYDEAGRLKTITDPASRQISLTYNVGGQVESAKDPMGYEVKYTYESGKLASVKLPGEASPRWQFKYDTSRRITEMIDGRGGKTKNEYDASSRVISQTDPAGRKLKFEYSSFHTKVTNETTGAVVDQWFTSNNQPFSITRGYGTASATTETFSYNEAGQLLTKTDGNGHPTTYEYDAEGNLKSEKDAEGNETKWTYNGTHDVISTTTPGGETTTIVRDANGNPETISRPAPEEATQTTTFEYDANGLLESITDPLERETSFSYNSQGDRTSEIDAAGNTTTWEYDKDSRLTSFVSPRGNLEGAEPAEYETEIELDAQGRPLKVIDPLGGSAEYAYDGNGNVSSVKDPHGHKTKYVFNAADEQIEVEKPNGAVLKTGYNGAGQATSQTDGKGKTTTYVRNALGQAVEVIDPLERKTIVAFDDAGNVKSVIDPAERTTSYVYDKADRLMKISYSDEVTPTVEFEYDANGNVTSMSDGTGESTYAYDQLGQLTGFEDGHGSAIGYDYDIAGQQISITYPNGKSIERDFDLAGRLEGISDWLGGETSFIYDADSNLKSITYPSATGNVDSFSYDPAGRMSTTTFKKSAETLASLTYGRDNAGQIDEATSAGLPGASEVAYGYDANDRLIEAGATSFEYDNADNLTKGLGSTNTYDAASELETGTGLAYTYDKLGQRSKVTPESGPATTYKYDQAGNLSSVERPAEGEVAAIDKSFTYDGTGLLALDNSGLTTKHLSWDVSRELPLILNDGSNSYIYGPAGLPIMQISAEEKPAYLHHDQLGSTRMLTNASGEVSGTFTYGPYGGLEGQTGSATTSLGFAGQFTEPQTGLQYLRARFYDPATAQFLSRDPLAEVTREPYGYAHQNPLQFIDPTGMACIENSPVFGTPIPYPNLGDCADAALGTVTSAPGFVFNHAPELLPVGGGIACVIAPFTCPFAFASSLGLSLALDFANSQQDPCFDLPHAIFEDLVVTAAAFLPGGGFGTVAGKVAGAGVTPTRRRVIQGVLDAPGVGLEVIHARKQREKQQP